MTQSTDSTNLSQEQEHRIINPLLAISAPPKGPDLDRDFADALDAFHAATVEYPDFSLSQLGSDFEQLQRGWLSQLGSDFEQLLQRG